MKAGKAVFLACLIMLSLCVVNTQPVNSTENSWTTKEPMPTARGGLGVAVVDGKIYVIGGTNDSRLNVNEQYDPYTDSWTTKTPMPTARRDFGIAVCQNKIYVIGGNAEDTDDVNEVYDPSTDTWETKTPMPTPRVGLCANVVNGKIYLIGGNTYSQLAWPILCNKTEVYDPVTDSWTEKTPMPNFVDLGFADITSAVVDNKIYVMGSKEGDGTDLNKIYDPETDTWSSGANLPTEVYWPAATATTGVFAPKRIHVLSGYTHRIYDPENDVWSTATSMHTPRVNLGVAVINDSLYAIGGNLNDIWEPHSETDLNEHFIPLGWNGTISQDTTPPTVSLDSPENKTYPSGDVPLVFKVSELTSVVCYSLDRQANVTVTGNTTLTGLSNGVHNLTVYADDFAGNSGVSETVCFTIAQQSDLEPSEPEQSEPYPTTWVVVATTIIVVAIVTSMFYVIRKRKK